MKFIFIFILAGCSSSGEKLNEGVKLTNPYWVKAITPEQSNIDTTDKKSEAVQTKTECPSQCDGQSTTVFSKGENNKCEVEFILPCYPYSCDKKNNLCGKSCSSDSECAVGAVCNKATKLCAPYVAMCSDNEHIIDSRGAVYSCSPFSCEAGACKESCRDNSNCAYGFKCDDFKCVEK